jgi:hypothetical protein
MGEEGETLCLLKERKEAEKKRGGRKGGITNG